MKKAIVLDHSKSPCDEDIVPDSLSGTPILLFIKMDHLKDFSTWLQVAKVIRSILVACSCIKA